MKRKIEIIISGFFFVLCTFIIIFESLQNGGNSSLKSGFFASLFDFGKKEAEIIEPERIELQGPVECNIRETLTLDVVFYPENVTDSRVTFEVEDPTILQIEESGVVHPLQVGTTTIYAYSTHAPSIRTSKVISITRREITSFTIGIEGMEENGQVSIPNGCFRYLTYVGSTLGDYSPRDVEWILPEDGTLSLSHGLLKAQSNVETEVVLQARIKNTQILSNEISIKILPREEGFVAPTEISLDVPETLYIGDTFDLEAPQFNEGCDERHYAMASEDSSALRVTSLDRERKSLTAYKEGEIRVKVFSLFDETICVEKNIQVLPVLLSEIQVGVEQVIQYGTMTQIQYQTISTMEGKEASYVEMEFVSSNPKVVSIDEKGNLIGYQKGVAEITITSKSQPEISSTIRIRVTSLTEQKYGELNYMVRKILGHFLLFGATGFFGTIFLSLILDKKNLWLCVALPSGIYGLVLAVSSELLQSLPGGRTPAFGDILIDFSGFLLGIAVIVLFIYFMKHRKKKNA